MNWGYTYEQELFFYFKKCKYYKTDCINICSYYYFCLIISESQPISFSFHNLEIMDTHWSFNEQDVSLPFHLPVKKNTVIQLKNQLPAEIASENVLCFPSNFC